MSDAQIEAQVPKKRGRKKKETEAKKTVTKKTVTKKTEAKKTEAKKKNNPTEDSALNKLEISKEEIESKKPVTQKNNLTKDSKLNKEKINVEKKVNENTKAEKKNLINEDNILEYRKKFNEKLEQINLRKSKLEDFTTNYEKLYKDIEHAIKISKEKEKKLILPPRFDKPTLLSQKLADFLNKPYGTELSRIDVTHQILEYIWKHNLLNDSENKEITCNEDLCHLLNVDLELDIVTVFNLRRYIKHNYPDDYLK